MEDMDLIRLIQYEPEHGIHEAMQLYGRAVNTICKSILTNCEDGLLDEAVSDTFFKLWKNSSRFSIEKGHSLKSYIYSIARNTAIDIKRKNGYQMISLDEELEIDIDAGISVENQVHKNILSETVHQAIQMLGEPDNQVFLYKYFLCLRNKQIANMLKLSEKKVENILYRGKGKMRKLLLERGITYYEN